MAGSSLHKGEDKVSEGAYKAQGGRCGAWRYPEMGEVKQYEYAIRGVSQRGHVEDSQSLKARIL